MARLKIVVAKNTTMTCGSQEIQMSKDHEPGSLCHAPSQFVVTRAQHGYVWTSRGRDQEGTTGIDGDVLNRWPCTCNLRVFMDVDAYVFIYVLFLDVWMMFVDAFVNIC